ncbi:MAG: hypothetical protein HY747_05155 [Elusimicrobia bacterium]|nr:hypothetical protein [Elusimicrobiota bacterium]
MPKKIKTKTAGKKKVKKTARKPAAKKTGKRRVRPKIRPKAKAVSDRPQGSAFSLGVKAPALQTAAAPKPAAAVPAPAPEVVEGTLLGEVEDFYSHVQSIAVTLKGEIAAGDTIRVKGHTTDLVQKVESMQVNHVTITLGKPGDAVGIKVAERCRKGDRVYKI